MCDLIAAGYRCFLLLPLTLERTIPGLERSMISSIHSLLSISAGRLLIDCRWDTSCRKKNTSHNKRWPFFYVLLWVLSHLQNHKEHLFSLQLAAPGWQIWLDDVFPVAQEFAGVVHLLTSVYLVVSVCYRQKHRHDQKSFLSLMGLMNTEKNIYLCCFGSSIVLCWAIGGLSILGLLYSICTCEECLSSDRWSDSWLPADSTGWGGFSFSSSASFSISG